MNFSITKYICLLSEEIRLKNLNFLNTQNNSKNLFINKPLMTNQKIFENIKKQQKNLLISQQQELIKKDNYLIQKSPKNAMTNSLPNYFEEKFSKLIIELLKTEQDFVSDLHKVDFFFIKKINFLGFFSLSAYKFFLFFFLNF